MTPDTVRTRAVSLFEYLRELELLKSKRVLDCENYEEVFWFADVPKYRTWKNIASGIEQVVDDEIWLEVTRVAEPKCPEPPQQCTPWVDANALRNTGTTPQLREKALASDIESADAGNAAKFILLAENPDVEVQWSSYVSNQWTPWAERHRYWTVLHNVYSRLYTIYKLQNKLQEAYELVLGLGLLCCRTSAGAVVRRHLLVGQAEISLDLESGTIRVGAKSGGVALAFEADMLEPGQQPRREEQVEIERLLDGCSDSPWDVPSVETMLKAWVHAADPGGQYEGALEKPRDITQSIRVTLAPALILRRRSGRSMQRCFEDIVRQLKTQNDGVPFGIRRICEVVDDSGHELPTQERHGGPTGDVSGDPYFPLPTNEEQRQIAERLRDRRGILVQGPPGTGKSHTIANLICHLLACGKRVLVTSQTPRALQVLTEKIPAEIRPLCVCVLGNDREALGNLQDAVARIENQFHTWSSDENARRIATLDTTRRQTRERTADVSTRLRECAERETSTHRVAGGAYSGTAQAIAKQFASNADRLSWMPDAICEGTDMPFGSDIFMSLRGAYVKLPQERCRELALAVPDVACIPGVDDFLNLVRAEQSAKATLDRHGLASAPPMVVAEARVRVCADSLRAFMAAVSRAVSRPAKWMSAAVQSVLAGKQGVWQQLRHDTSESVSQLKVEASVAGACQVALPNGVDDAAVRADAEDLLAHMEAGGSLGWWFFAPVVARRTRYLQGTVRVAGRACDNPKALKELLSCLRTRSLLASMTRAWASIEELATTQPLTIVIAELEERAKALDIALSIREPLDLAVQQVSELGLAAPVWHDQADVTRLCERLDGIAALIAYDRTRSVLNGHADKLRSLAARPSAHPVVQEAISALDSRDDGKWARILDTLAHLEDDRRLLRQRDEWGRMLSARAPRLADHIAVTAVDSGWEDKLKDIEGAWQWSQADSWLRGYLAAHDRPALEEELRQQQDVVSRDTAHLAAAKAWRHCFERMTDHQRMALVAWAKAIKRVGKGTGKWAGKHRKDAEEHLEVCRSAIPAWVMPLYRVAESRMCKPELFDVVIVDEASQCGPEGLLLFYLAKQVLVVGDDQQISPEAVGVDQEAVSLLQQRYLKDVPFSDSLGVQSSVFTQGEIRFGGRIVLREHFRCMPEIIRFSNDLCYSATPLRCLRQYQPNRLDPIKTVHVATGHKEGGRRSINRPEAEVLARQVVECCKDSAYFGKTMGVISLLGEDQALLIQNLILQQLPPEEAERRRLVCGDAYAFQGDERDVIFLSLVVAPNERIGALVRESDKQRFNVAASRARDQLWLFHSVTLNDLNPSCVRHKLLYYVQNPEAPATALPSGLDIEQLRVSAASSHRRAGAQPQPFDSWFEVDVFLRLAERGYRVLPQYPVSSYFIDLVVEGFETRLAIECDGDGAHPPEKWEQDAHRQRVLERCGWTFWRLRGSEFYWNPAKALEPLWMKLALMEILPGAQPSARQVEKIQTATESAAVEDEARPFEEQPEIPATDVVHETPVATERPEISATDIARESPATYPERSEPRERNEHARPVAKDTQHQSNDDKHKMEVAQQQERLPPEPTAADNDDAANIAWAATVPADVWFAMSHWAKVEGKLDGWERSLLFSLGRLARDGHPPSVKQARHARRLHQSAAQLGFIADGEKAV